MIKKLVIATLLLVALPATAATWMDSYTGGTSGSGFLPTNSVNQTSGATISTPGAAVGVPGTVSGYTPLEPLKAGFASYRDFSDYLGTIYKLTITIGALIAVVMLVTGGVRYMLSEGFTDIDKAKLRIRSALWGLLVLVGSFLILYSINPNLLNFNLLIPSLKQQASNFNAATGGSNNTDTSVCSMVCPNGYYCEPTIRRCTVNSFKKVQENTEACRAVGGTWQTDTFSQYCKLTNATDAASCARAGGVWYDPSYVFAPYCYKP
jgi:hypothetical protein